MTFDIVALGEPLYEFSEVARGGREYLQGFGGDTSNCAIAAARQGARVAYLTCVGGDEFGRQFLTLWRQEGIDTSGVEIDHAAHTAVYFISHGPQGHTFSYLRAGSAASRMRPDRLPPALLRNTRFFHASGISQAISDSACDAVFAAVETAKAAGAQFVYDANVRLRLWSAQRAAAIIAATVAFSDVFFLSVEDAQVLCGKTEPDAVLDWCHERGARCAILKRGAHGAVASDGGKRWKVDGYSVTAVDATGAGDCFAGAAMARLAAGDDMEAALRYASAAAALACTGFGAVTPLPRPDAVAALMRTAGRRMPQPG